MVTKSIITRSPICGAMTEDQDKDPRRKRERQELLSSYLHGKGTGKGTDGSGSVGKDWYVPPRSFPYRPNSSTAKGPDEMKGRDVQKRGPRDLRPHGMNSARVMRHGPDMVVKLGPWARPSRPKVSVATPPGRTGYHRPEPGSEEDEGPAPEGPALRDEFIRSMVRRRCEKDVKDEVTIKDVVDKAMALPVPGQRKKVETPEAARTAPQPGPAPEEPSHPATACITDVENAKASETAQEAREATPTDEMTQPAVHETEDMKVTGPLPPDVAVGEKCPACGTPVGPRNEPIVCTSCGKRTCSECGAYEEAHQRSPIQHDYRFEWPLCYECYMKAFETQLALARAIMCFGNGNLGYATFYSKKALEQGVGSVYEKEIKDLIQTIDKYQERSAVYDKHWEKKREHIIRSKFSDPAWK